MILADDGRVVILVVAEVYRGFPESLPSLSGRGAGWYDSWRRTVETMIPDFRDDGYLPEGVHLASEAEVTFRFGASSPRRRRLVLRLRRWIELARLTGASRFLVDGSFLTAKEEPNDVDAVVLLA